MRLLPSRPVLRRGCGAAPVADAPAREGRRRRRPRCTRPGQVCKPEHVPRFGLVLLPRRRRRCRAAASGPLGTSPAHGTAKRRFRRRHSAQKRRGRSGQVEKVVGFPGKDKLWPRQVPGDTPGTRAGRRSRCQSAENQAAPSSVLVEPLVSEEINVESPEGMVRAEESVVPSISGIRPALAFI